MRVHRSRSGVRVGILIALCLMVLGSTPLAKAQTQPIRIYVHYDTGWGNSLSIRGNTSPLNWSSGQPMTWTSGNVWYWEGPSTLSAFEFKVLINDSKWSTGSNYKVTSTTSRSLHIYPFFGPAQGRLVTISNFYSPQLNNSRNIVLYLPPSYYENTAKRYPVLYMHDGQNLFNASTAFGGVEWQVDETLNSMIGQGTAQETIVVGIYNNSNRISEYTPTVDPGYGGGNANAYLNFVQQTLKPHIDSNYRTLSDTKNTLMMGSSLGGLLSCYAGWTRPAVYGGVGCMSSSFWWNNQRFTQDIEVYQGKKPSRFYIDAGANNDGAPQTIRARDALLADGYQYNLDLSYYYDPNGSHNEASWARRLPTPLKYLLPPTGEYRLN